MSKLDLPEHLQERLHNDWLPGLRWIPRGWSAFGHRHSGWRRVPKLLVGYNTTRWMTPGDRDVIHIQWKKGLSIGGINMGNYGPSPLQKRSKIGWSLVWPLHFEFHWQYEWKGDDKVVLYRKGPRWDSLDEYYNWNWPITIVYIALGYLIAGSLGGLIAGLIGPDYWGLEWN